MGHNLLVHFIFMLKYLDYILFRCFELPGSKTKCWTNIGDNIQAHKQELNLKISEAALALFTHFAVAGSSYPTLATGEHCIDDIIVT